MADVRAMLSDADLLLLRGGYDRALMGKLAVAAVASSYPEVMPWTAAVGEAFYFHPDDAEAKHRETVLLAVLTVQRAPGQLAIHVYWALMEGHTVEEVMRTLHLAGTYAGLPSWTIAQGVATKVIALLATHVAMARTDPAAVDCRRIAPAISVAIPS